MNILITSAGKRVSLVRAFQEELKQLYPYGKVFATDLHPQMSAACQVADGSFKVVAVSDSSYLNQLMAICLQHDIRMVIPTIDTELLVMARNKRQFEQEGISLIVSSFALVDICRDKRKTKTLLDGLGINTPDYINKAKPSYPFFIKPYDGSLSAGTCVVHSSADIRPEHLENDRYLFMEYYSPDEYDEYTVDMYFDRTHRARCIVPRKRISVRAGEINKGITCKNNLLAFLRDRLSYLEGASGCITLQFFMHKVIGSITAIEINARFGGGYPLSYRAGANYPRWLISEYFNNETIPYYEDWKDGTLMLRYDEEIIVYADKSEPEKLLHLRS